jgi:hypothetical protein
MRSSLTGTAQHLSKLPKEQQTDTIATRERDREREKER